MHSRLTLFSLAAMLLAGAPAGASAAAATAPAAPRCSGAAARPAQLSLYMGKSTMMRLQEAVQYRSVGNPDVVQALLVAPDTLYIAGVDVGTTNMIMQGKSGACSVVDVTVSLDPAALRTTLAAVLPDEKDIVVTTAADTIVLSGSVSDAVAAARAGELAAAYVRRPLRALQTPKEEGVAAAAAPAAGTTAAAVRVINMLGVSAPQQVLLEVKIAEVSKTLIESLEAGATFKFSSGSWTTTLLANFLSGATGASLAAQKSNGNQFSLGADKHDALVRMLAEPNVMAISGQEGTFLAGGKFYIPVAQENNRITLEEKEFGVGLRFTPTVLGGGRINLHVAPEVSELSREGIGVTASGSTGTSILPVITTRRASTTVQLRDGQSFAIGGLLKNNLVGNLKALPGLGEVPVLGALFRSTDYQQDRTELVFVITAHLVKPLPPDYSLPTDALVVPSRGEMLLGGKLEGQPAPAAKPPAPVRTGAGFELK